MNLLDEAVSVTRRLEKEARIPRDQWYWARLSQLVRVTMLSTASPAMHDAITRAANAAVTSCKRGPCNWAKQAELADSRALSKTIAASRAKQEAKRVARLQAESKTKASSHPTALSTAFAKGKAHHSSVSSARI